MMFRVCSAEPNAYNFGADCTGVEGFADPILSEPNIDGALHAADAVPDLVESFQMSHLALGHGLGLGLPLAVGPVVVPKLNVEAIEPKLKVPADGGRLKLNAVAAGIELTAPVPVPVSD